MKPLSGKRKSILLTSGLLVLACVLTWMLLVLTRDNALWGDEAFSANTVRNDLSGIREVLYYIDVHPPLYYAYLRCVTLCMGLTGEALHLASVFPVILLLFFTATVVRKKLGAFAAAFLMISISLAQECVRYAVEVRMYSLVFSAALLCAYFSYRAIDGAKAAWAGMAISASFASYSHYYGLVCCGLLLFFTMIAAWIKERTGKTLLYGAGSILLLIISYVPWLPTLRAQMSAVGRSHWVEQSAPLRELLKLMFGGGNMKWVVCLLFFGGGFVLLVKRRHKKAQTALLSVFAGGVTALMVILFSYGYELISRPILQVRYVYPLTAIVLFETALLLSVCAAFFSDRRAVLPCMIAILSFTAFAGIRDYRAYYETFTRERDGTAKTLELIGEVPPETQFITWNVKHLSWTVLQYHFPGNPVSNENIAAVEAPDFWYFCDLPLSQAEREMMRERGYTLDEYGNHVISQYPFVLYHVHF